MSIIYPGSPVAVQDGDKLLAERFMKNPNVVSRALYDLTRERFLGDFLLTQRYTVVGGAVLFENGDDDIEAADQAEVVAPGAEYPLTTFGSGTLAAAQAVKRGQSADVTDEAVARWAFDPVQRGLRRIANSQIRQNDQIALSVIQSRVTDTFTASGTWDDVERIIEDSLIAAAWAQEQRYNLGEEVYDYNTIVLKPTQHAKVVAKLVTSGVLPRETNNIVAGDGAAVVNYLGKTWVTGIHVPFSDPFVVDRDQLGGMGFEDLGGGYTRSENGLETKVIRDDRRDKSTIQARRVAVPVVRDVHAGYRITGTGL